MTKLRKTMLAMAAMAATSALVAAAPGAERGEQNEAVTGDAARGKALVESSGCFDCHRIADRGSRVGPNLSTIGGRRTPVRLRQALLAPDEEVIADNRFVRIVTKDGTTITGKLLNQDATSVQLMNPKEELKTYLRTSIREYTIVDTGLMPSVQGKLTDQQVADIVSYLGSLKGS
jgi:quinoprotein glucose dehydrogenase